MKKLVLFVSLCVAMCACNDNALMNEPIQESETILSRSGETTSAENYTVTPEMVCKYLNIARKGKTINSLTPVIENGDTLAYVAQYADTLGWDLISGDRRLYPVLANSEAGVLNLSDTINPAVGAVKGMIGIVKETKEKNDTLKNNIWKFLEPKEVKTINSPQARGWGFGKWVALDTIYENNSYTRPHIIATKWGQDNPWNTYTPRINGINTKVGCVPVAVGQIIYHFRKNNHRDITLPSTVTFSNSYNGEPIFSDSTTSLWSTIELNRDAVVNINNSSTPKFLSYIGKQMNSIYGEETGTDIANIEPLLSQYKIAYNRLNVYNFYTILNDLEVSKPVFISMSGHSFIIDAYKHSYERMYIEYEWDPNYELQEGDEVVEPPMDASSSKDGYAYREEEISYYESYSLMMNWGWQGNYDNTSYLACTSSRWTMDESPVVRYYSPHWTVNGHTYSELNFLLYDLCDSE